jgi:hypothetical protein
MNTKPASLFFIVKVFFVAVLVFELRTSYLLGRHLSHSISPSVYIFIYLFGRERLF